MFVRSATSMTINTLCAKKKVIVSALIGRPFLHKPGPFWGVFIAKFPASAFQLLGPNPMAVIGCQPGI